jgi:hypothetical protein
MSAVTKTLLSFIKTGENVTTGKFEIKKFSFGNVTPFLTDH